MEEENVDITTVNVAETPVTEMVQDTVETPAEKTFTQEQLDKIVKERVERATRAESRKYDKIIGKLQRGTGTKNLNELENAITNFYNQEGNTNQPYYDDREEEILADAEAKDVIDLGYDEIVAETDSLMAKGNDNLSLREKFLYKKLADERKKIEQTKELKSIGVGDDIISSQDFKDFRSKFNENTPLKDVYDLYSKLKPKEEVHPIGSMKTDTNKDEIKDYYSPEDFDKLTPEQLDDPRIMEAIDKSRVKWLRR
ncbi:MAG: hypothetical protein J6Z11_13825 [Candidatus Riflebacteria bacterium]|nr:hypothetical protein [Candidatus Riflebacteria bacterium]